MLHRKDKFSFGNFNQADNTKYKTDNVDTFLSVQRLTVGPMASSRFFFKAEKWRE